MTDTESQGTGEYPTLTGPRFTPAERCDHDALNIEDIQKSWGMGWLCLLCGRPVAIRITHYGGGLYPPSSARPEPDVCCGPGPHRGGFGFCECECHDSAAPRSARPEGGSDA